MDFSSMRPSSWNGVGAIAKVPAALAVSFVICASSFFGHSGACEACISDVQLHIGESRDSGFDAEPVIGPRFARTRWHRPGMTFTSKPSRAHLDLLVGEEYLPGVLADILCLPSAVRRFPTFHFHHPHLAHAAGSGNAQNLAGLIARQIAHHV